MVSVALAVSALGAGLGLALFIFLWAGIKFQFNSDTFTPHVITNLNRQNKPRRSLLDRWLDDHLHAQDALSSQIAKDQSATKKCVRALRVPTRRPNGLGLFAALVPSVAALCINGWAGLLGLQRLGVAIAGLLVTLALAYRFDRTLECTLGADGLRIEGRFVRYGAIARCTLWTPEGASVVKGVQLWISEHDVLTVRTSDDLTARHLQVIVEAERSRSADAETRAVEPLLREQGFRVSATQPPLRIRLAEALTEPERVRVLASEATEDLYAIQQETADPELEQVITQVLAQRARRPD
jgi:hypothetical protein